MTASLPAARATVRVLRPVCDLSVLNEKDDNKSGVPVSLRRSLEAVYEVCVRNSSSDSMIESSGYNPDDSDKANELGPLYSTPLATAVMAEITRQIELTINEHCEQHMNEMDEALQDLVGDDETDGAARRDGRGVERRQDGAAQVAA